jgi:tetratricopeptide (TPR) repeat protein
MQYKGTRKDVGQIGRELGVEYVLEGSVRRAGERVRVSAQLIHVSDQTHLWADSYDRHLTDMLTLQGEVAQAVTQKIEIKLTPPEQRRMPRPSGIDHQAYDACLQGRFHWHQLSRYHFDTALQYFELALSLDPNYALAHEGVAAVWLIRGDNGLIAPHEAFPKARAAITRAVELDGTLADAHKTLANLLFLYEWDWSGAEAAFHQAISLNPSLADVHLFYADLLISTGRVDKWKGEIQRALEIDPFNFFLRCFHGWHLVYLRRYEEAIAQFYETVKTEPSFPSAHMGLWGAFYQQQKYDQALKEAKTFFAAIGDNELAEALEHRHPKRRYAEAMHRAAKILEARAQRSYVPSVRIARLYAHAEATALALDSLEKAYEQREPPLVHLKVGWDWDKLRDSPRFQRLLRRMNLLS